MTVALTVSFLGSLPAQASVPTHISGSSVASMAFSALTGSGISQMDLPSPIQSPSGGAASPMDVAGQYYRYCEGSNGSTWAWPDWQDPALCQGMMDVYISGNQVAHYNAYLYSLGSDRNPITLTCMAGLTYLWMTAGGDVTPLGWVNDAVAGSLTILGCLGY